MFASAGDASRAGWFTPATLALAALALSLALQVNFGQYHPAAMPWLTLALLACVAAAVVPNVGRGTILNWRPDQLVLAVALAVLFALMWVNQPLVTKRHIADDDLALFKAGVALAAALVAVGVSGTRAARAAVPLMLLAYLGLGLWVLRLAPAPPMGSDVFVFQRDACAALLHGMNPYAITFPNIFGPGTPLYGAGVVSGDRVNFGYPYPPLSLVYVLPGHLLGDVRYAHLLAMTLAGALIAYARPAGGEGAGAPGGRSAAAAAMLLFMPRGFAVTEVGCTEPLAILTLAATVFAFGRRGRGWAIAGAVACGLLLASKQYAVLVLPLLGLLPLKGSFGRKVALVGLMLLVTAAVTLPLALWDVRAFTHSAVMLQFRQPFRPDALSYLVPLGGNARLAYVAFAAAGAAALLALWRCPRTPSGFATGVALVLFAFFATNKQAFFNYYTLVFAALCCALSATPGIHCPRRARP
jgi:hypothetical protein